MLGRLRGFGGVSAGTAIRRRVSLTYWDAAVSTWFDRQANNDSHNFCSWIKYRTILRLPLFEGVCIVEEGVKLAAAASKGLLSSRFIYIAALERLSHTEM